MHALILANGKGTNLRPLTVYTPKPIVPIVNVPLLLFQIEILKRAGVDHITLFLDYQPGKIEHVLGSEEELGVEIRYVVEEKPFGTAGAFRYAACGERKRSIVINGDVFTDIALNRMLRYHEKSNASVTIATVPQIENTNYGVLRIGENNVVEDYISDPIGDEQLLSNAGIYILEPEICEEIGDDQSNTFKYDVFPDLVRREKGVYAFEIRDDYWCALNSVDAYLKAHYDFLAGKVKHLQTQQLGDFERATSAFIDSSSFIGKDCVIKPNAKIINSVLGKGVQVDEGARIEDSIIWSHTRVASGAKISGAIITSSCYIGKNSTISVGGVIGDKSSVSDYTRL